MATATKTFDCVEMKDRIQARIVAEFDAHRDEFPSFLAFIRARNKRSAWVRRMERKFSVPEENRSR